MSGHQKGSILSQQHADAAAKVRSASVDGGATVTGPLAHVDFSERVYANENNDENSRRQSSPLLSDSGNGGDVITASLKIPVPSTTSSTSFSLNLDDADIPYIEDTGGGGGYNITTESGRQHMTIGKFNYKYTAVSDDELYIMKSFPMYFDLIVCVCCGCVCERETEREREILLMYHKLRPNKLYMSNCGGILFMILKYCSVFLTLTGM